MRARTSLPGLLALVAAALLGACGGEEPVVYVPGTGFVEGLHVTTGRGTRARIDRGEPLVLHAQRRSGPWRAVPADEVGEGQCSTSVLPAQLEAEVADGVTWLIEPPGHATLEPAEEGRGAMEIRFDSAGTYRLTAESPSPCGPPFRGGSLEVEVVG